MSKSSLKSCFCLEQLRNIKTSKRAKNRNAQEFKKQIFEINFLCLFLKPISSEMPISSDSFFSLWNDRNSEQKGEKTQCLYAIFFCVHGSFPLSKTLPKAIISFCKFALCSMFFLPFLGRVCRMFAEDCTRNKMANSSADLFFYENLLKEMCLKFIVGQAMEI